MKKTKFRRLAAMAASLLCCLIFTVPAYAQSSEPQPETAPSPAETEAEPETQNPFTPDGTGTVVDNATDEALSVVLTALILISGRLTVSPALVKVQVVTGGL